MAILLPGFAVNRQKGQEAGWPRPHNPAHVLNLSEPEFKSTDYALMRQLGHHRLCEHACSLLIWEWSHIFNYFEIIDGIKNDIDKGDFIIATYLDLKKAFDTVNHHILFNKLEHYGIRGMPLQFFQSYLSNRKHYVCYNNTSSYTITNDYGVPQGSVLDNIVNAVNGIKIRLFVDDTALLSREKISK